MFTCPNCGTTLVGLACYNDWCNWKPSIADQIAWEERKERLRKKHGEDEE